MDMIKLANEIINGRRLTKDDDLSFFIDCDLDSLCEGADMIREHFTGDAVDLCSIINGRSGKCPENCKYCAQSAHYDTNCKEYAFLPDEEIINACKGNEKEGVTRFSIVTAGRALTGEEFERALNVYKKLLVECPSIKQCASLGFLSKEQLLKLKEIGVNHYHHNIETSRNFFPKICTTHTFDQKLETLKILKEIGMRICSGGIIGMGETFEDRIDMALTLAEYEVHSIPLNVLMPIKGTPLENQPPMEENDILRTIALFKYINPTTDVRLAAGRVLLTDSGKKAFSSGASATITGNMLTTAGCATIKSDIKMLTDMGRTIL